MPRVWRVDLLLRPRADGRPVPSSQADDAELRALVEVVGRHRGHVELIPAAVAMHRAEALGQLERIGRWCGEHGASMSWNGFLDLEGDPSLSATFLDLARRLQAAGRAWICRSRRGRSS